MSLAEIEGKFGTPKSPGVKATGRFSPINPGPVIEGDDITHSTSYWTDQYGDTTGTEQDQEWEFLAHAGIGKFVWMYGQRPVKALHVRKIMVNMAEHGYSPYRPILVVLLTPEVIRRRLEQVDLAILNTTKSRKGYMVPSLLERKKAQEGLVGRVLSSPHQCLIEINDGQHRFCAARSLGIKVPYQFIDDRFDPYEELERGNDYASSWSARDRFHYQQHIGNEAIVLTADFAKRHAISAATALIVMGYRSYGVRTNGHATKSQRDSFNVGSLVLNDLDREAAEAVMKRIEDVTGLRDELGEIHPIAKKFGRKDAFIRALLVVVTHPDYDHKRFMHALVMYGGSLLAVSGSSFHAYIDQLQTIYNHKLQNNKLDFKALPLHRFNDDDF